MLLPTRLRLKVEPPSPTDATRPTKRLLLNSLHRLIDSRQIDDSALRIEMIGSCDAPITSAATQASWFRCDGVEVPKAEADRLAAESDGLILLDLTKS